MREAVHLLRPADRDRDPAGPVARLGVAWHIDDRETAEMLLGLGERPVGEDGRAATRVDAAHGGRRVEAAVAEDEDAGRRHLLDQGPPSGDDLRRGELLELGERFAVELDPPSVPPAYARAVLSAYRKGQLTAARTVELLRRSVGEADLPEPDAMSLDELRREFETGCD